MNHCLKIRIRVGTPLFLWMPYIWKSRVTNSYVFLAGGEREIGRDGEGNREKQSNKSGNRELNRIEENRRTP